MHTHLCAAAIVCTGVLAACASPALATFPGENGRILFDSDREGDDIDIWSMRSDGSKAANLTADGSHPPVPLGESEHFDALASWRSDGRKIAFVSDRPTPTNTEGDNEVYVMNADGSNQRQITFNALTERYTGWSPDGDEIVFTRDLDPDRTDDEHDVDIFTMNADGSQQRNRTNTPGVDDVQPVWSPNGRQVVFVSDGDGDNEIYTMNPHGWDIRQLTVNAHNDEFPDWSPDGRLIAFEADPFGRDVYKMRADGTKLTRLTNNPAPDGLPVWSPDGRYLAFASGRDGSADIFTMRADGRAQVNLTPTSPGFDYAPKWQPLNHHH